jgi:ribosomal protein L37AE/L43A
MEKKRKFSEIHKVTDDSPMCPFCMERVSPMMIYPHCKKCISEYEEAVGITAAPAPQRRRVDTT